LKFKKLCSKIQCLIVIRRWSEFYSWKGRWPKIIDSAATRLNNLIFILFVTILPLSRQLVSIFIL